jgi:ferritin-like metal-binding protein YciE
VAHERPWRKQNEPEAEKIFHPPPLKSTQRSQRRHSTQHIAARLQHVFASARQKPKPLKKPSAVGLVQRSINESLIRWLATNLNLDARLIEAITSGKSYSPKNVATAEDRAKAAFAKKFVQLISQELNQKFMFRAVRLTELMAESRVITVAIPAFQIKK